MATAAASTDKKYLARIVKYNSKMIFSFFVHAFTHEDMSQSHPVFRNLFPATMSGCLVDAK